MTGLALRRRLAAACGLLLALSLPTATALSAVPSAGEAGEGSLRVASTRLTVPSGSTAVPLRLSCTARTPCVANVRVDVGAAPGTWLRVWVGAGTTNKLYRIELSQAQRERTVFGGRVNGRVHISELSPRRVYLRSERITIGRASTLSTAYAERNWTPMETDTCPASLHRRYSAVAADGKRYPTWHPATVTDPATGQQCSFGHEHGDDPESSDIYSWAADFLGTDDGGSRAKGIPFGYVSEASVAHSEHGGHAMRHEDNVGHKVFVANDVRQVAASPRRQLTTTVDGQEVPLECDYLIKTHQGSHSPDATTNNAHEVIYAARCNDGTEVITATLFRFGDANEYHRSCDPTVVVPTNGSNLPDGDGGRRLIPDRSCVDEYVLRDGQRSDIWGLYEVWESETELTTSGGQVLAAHDPWFAVRNPSRYADPGTERGVAASLGTRWLTDPADGGVASGWPWSSIAEDASREQSSPESPFDGAQRDFYLAQTRLDNAGGPTTWYSTPYGEDARTEPFHGSVPQLVGSSTTSIPEVERRQLGLADDFGPAGSGVHSPN